MDAWINPVTADYEYVSGADLTAAPGNGLANACYLRLMTPLGSWFGDATLGSRLHELQREKDLARVERLAKQYATTALQPILDDGRASSIDITVERQKDDTGGGRLALAITVTDGQGQPTVFNVYVKVA